MGEQYVIYTAGNMGVTIKRYAEALKMKVIAFYDNNKELQGKEVDGVRVYSAEELEKFVKADSINNKIIIGSQYYHEEIQQEIWDKFGTQIIVIKADSIQKRYWNEIVSDVRRHWKNEYSVSYNAQVKDWLENIMSEVEYWIHTCAAPRGIHHEGYCDRINRRNTAFICERLKNKIQPNSIIVDAGCGICSQYGTIVENGRVQLVSMDPLAYFYNIINKKSRGIEEDMVQFGMFEFLSLFLGKSVADIVLIDNALDHCIDPFKSIIECFVTLKVGGILSMRHRRCEAVYEGYTGLHKWNVDVNDQNELILWNENNMKNVNKELLDYSDIEVVLHESKNRNDEYIDVNIIKKTEMDVNRFYNREECMKLAQVINEVMRLFSSESVNLQFSELLKEV